jgi:hypothetical protein
MWSSGDKQSVLGPLGRLHSPSMKLLARFLLRLTLVTLGLGLAPTSAFAAPPEAEKEPDARGEVVALAIPEGPELPDSVQASFAVRSEYMLDESFAPASGRAMIMAGSALSVLGFAGQLVGLKVVHDRCDGFSETSPEAVDFSSVQACGVGYQGGVAIVLTSAVAQLGGAPWVIAGAAKRGRHLAFNDFFIDRRSNSRTTRPWIWTGTGMLVAGASAWVASPIVALKNCKNSTSLTCSMDATTWGYGIGLSLLTSGGAMLARGLAYERRFSRFQERVEFRVSPQLGATQSDYLFEI